MPVCAIRGVIHRRLDLVFNFRIKNEIGNQNKYTKT